MDNQIMILSILTAAVGTITSMVAPYMDLLQACAYVLSITLSAIGIIRWAHGLFKKKDGKDT
jgi:hypothetical protein